MIWIKQEKQALRIQVKLIVCLLVCYTKKRNINLNWSTVDTTPRYRFEEIYTKIWLYVFMFVYNICCVYALQPKILFLPSVFLTINNDRFKSSCIHISRAFVRNFLLSTTFSHKMRWFFSGTLLFSLVCATPLMSWKTLQMSVLKRNETNR